LSWQQAGALYGPTIIMFGMLLAFIVKVLPAWKEVRLKELDLRANEMPLREKQAEALGKLADVLEAVAIEQRRATEETKILQRVNADASDQLTAHVRLLSDRITGIEDSGGTTLAHVAVDLNKLTVKVEEIAKYVESERARA
jgi:type VI protein secretion system component VasK